MVSLIKKWIGLIKSMIPNHVTIVPLSKMII